MPFPISPRTRPPLARSALTLALCCLGWAAPAGAQSAAAPPAAASAASAPGVAASAPARAPDPSAPKPFAEVIRDAKQQDGYFPLWRKDDKVWLEIAPERLGQPFLISANISHSVGERGLYGSQMGPSWMAEFRRVGNTLQLVAKNTDFRGGADAATQAAVRQAFSDSLLASGAVASAAHPERKSVLWDASALLTDLIGHGTRLESAYRLSYGLDRGNSYFETTRAEDGQTTLNARLHFSTARLPAPPLVPSPTPMPTPPSTTPDPRSLFIGVVYSLVQLPEKPMAPRLADPRVGHFTEDFTDFATDFNPNQRVHYISRWRLEKKEAGAALSEPVKPITFWLDRNIPLRYRETVTQGVLEWNKAFERIGFKDALVVRQQSDDADFDTMDGQHASIRWFVGSDVGFAIGPHRSDPRTGEILDADIGMSDVFARGARRLIVEDQPSAASAASTHGHRQELDCRFGQEAANEMGFALDLLEARGEIAPDSPEAEAFVLAVIKETITHEVGHTLGLKHNFKASTTLSQAQLRDPAYTAQNGISSSVMDYIPYNLALQGEAASTVTNRTLGAYDYWAIEYAYKPLEAAQEKEGLRQIAERSTDPALAFADDADADGPAALDPTVNRFDLGDDPLAWYERRLKLSRELWERVQARPAKSGDDPQRARRVLMSGFRQLRNLPELVAKYVGGMYTEHAVPGAQLRPVYRPVEPARQRQALKFLAEKVFSADSFQFRPEFLVTLGPDYQEWTRSAPLSIPAMVAQMQSQTLDRLLSAGTAQRVLDLPAYLPEVQRRNALPLDEVYGSLQSAIWSELRKGGEIDGLRRNLQREHLKRLVPMLTRGAASGMPADALSLLRWQANKLLAELKQAAARSSGSVETRAHLAESHGQLSEALKATMSRG